jgi:DNA repair exonuclease SbcCD ATPase subunit
MSLSTTKTFTSGKYKGKTYGEVYDIIETIDKNYLTRLKASKKTEFLEYYNERKEHEEQLAKANNPEAGTAVPAYEPRVLSSEKIKLIFHLADVHIRNYERMDEYLTVFARLYESLRKEKNGLIIICGDIIHNKNDLSPEAVIMARNFFLTLASIHPVIIIAGNHDGVVNNNNRIDSLTAILTGLDLPNLYYLRDSGVYTYGNLTFGVSGVFDKQFVSASQLPNDGNIKISLYHETIDTSKNLVGYELNGRKLVQDFDGYDYCLLGDVHFYQYLNKEKTMAYPSSLISQDITEVDLDHGYLRWDLEAKTSTYQRIENDYQQQSFEIRDKLITVNVTEHLTVNEFNTYLETTKLPCKGTFRIKYDDDTELIDVKKFVTIIEKNTTHANFRYEKSLTPLSKKDSTDTEEENESKWVKLEKYCKENKYDYNRVRDELGKLMKDIVFNPKSRANWKLKELRFKNMFGYAGINVLDFTKYPPHEVVGIFAKNKFGKTSLIDIILFMLFSKCSRFSKDQNPPIDIIHNDHTSFDAELEFLVGTDLYCIKKWASVSKREKVKNVKVNVSFFKNGESLDEKDRKKTQDTIESIIGTFETFLATSVFVQQSNDCFFMSRNETKKKEFLYEILELDIFKGIEETIKTECTKIKINLENVYEKIKNVKRDDVEKECNILAKEVEDLENGITQAENKIKELKKSIEVNEKNLHSVLPCDAIDKIISEAVKNINYYEKELEEKQKTLNILESQLSSSFSLLSLEDKIHEDHKRIHDEILLLNGQIRPSLKTTEPRAELEAQLEKLREIYDEKILDNLINLNLNPTIKELKKKLIYNVVEEIPNEKEIEDLKIFISKNHDINSRLEINTKNVEKKKELETKLKNCLEMQTMLNTHQYDPNCKFCVANPFVVDAKEQISKITKLKKESTSIVIEDLEDTCKTYHNSVKRLQFLEKQANAIENNKKCEELKNEIEDMEAQMDYKHNILSAQREAETVERKLNFYENTIIQNKIDVLQKDDKFDDLYKEKNAAKALVARIDKIKEELRTLQTNLVHTKSSLTSNKEMKILSEENEILLKEIRSTRESIDNIHSTILPNVVLRNKKSCSLDEKIKILSDYDENLKIHTELTDRDKFYTQLKILMSKNGFSLYLLNSSLKTITKRVNSFIEHYIGRTIEMTVEGDHIVITSKDGDHYTNIYSGAEAFVLELAFKLVFANMAQLPQSNILFIDEHVSCLDSERIEEFDRITEFLKNNYSLSFIISHIGTLKNFIKYNITIEKNENKSKLVT